MVMKWENGIIEYTCEKQTPSNIRGKLKKMTAHNIVIEELKKFSLDVSRIGILTRWR